MVRTASLPTTSGSKYIMLMSAYSLLKVRQEFLTLYCQLEILRKALFRKWKQIPAKVVPTLYSRERQRLLNLG